MARLRRRIFSSINLLTTLLFLGFLFIMINFIASRRYARWDFTRQKITALSDQTLQTLTHLKEPLSLIVFYQPGHRLYELVNDLATEYARVSPQVKIERVDPEQDVARARQLVKEFQIDASNPEALNVVIVQSGTHHKHLSDTDLAEYDYSSMTMRAEPRVKAFKGEAAITSAIISVTQTETPLVWFTTGHGEKSTEGQALIGLSQLHLALEQQNMTVKEMTLLGQSSIPAEVKAIIIAGPTHRFADNETAMLQTYLDRGGRLFALIDPLDDTGLDSLLERWGIRLGLDIVVDPSHQLPFVSPGNLLITNYTQHPIVERMKTLVTLYPLARSVRPTNPIPAGLTVSPLALTSEAGWGETKTDVSTFQFNAGEDLKGPVSIAVAAEHAPVSAPTPPATAAAHPRIVVFGDSDFVSNSQLGNVGNRDMAMGALYWLLEQEQRIGIGPKPIESIKLNVTGGQLRGIFWFSFLVMPMFCGMLGVGMWWIRRT